MWSSEIVAYMSPHQESANIIWEQIFSIRTSSSGAKHRLAES